MTHGPTPPPLTLAEQALASSPLQPRVALGRAVLPHGQERTMPSFTEQNPDQDQDRYVFHTRDATRENILLRLGLCGAGGSGKTWSALAIACALSEMLDLGPVHAIDSEHGSLQRYAHSPRTGRGFRFKHTPMPEGNYSPAAYIAAFDHVCRNEGARIVIVDSISHEYDGAGGILEIVDRAAGPRGDSMSGWRVASPKHRQFLEALLNVPAHVIFTCRAKTKYESKRENGKLKFEKSGEGPVQRDGIEYEPDVWGWMADATLTIDKTRVDTLEPGSAWLKPGKDVAALLADWIRDAEPSAERMLVEAVNAAVAEGVLAAEERSSERYKAAKKGLIAWCTEHDVSPMRRDVALAQFKERVAAIAGPRVAPDAPAEQGAPRAGAAS